MNVGRNPIVFSLFVCLFAFLGATQRLCHFFVQNSFISISDKLGSAVAQWLSAWLETEGPRVRASPALLGCGP